MTENKKDVALTKAAEGADVAKRSGAKSERSPVRIRSGPPFDNSTILPNSQYARHLLYRKW